MKAGQTIEVTRTFQVRVPKVASYAYQLIVQLFPLSGIPLDLRTSGRWTGKDAQSNRYQENTAYLRFPGQHYHALVRSWENVVDSKGPKRKTLADLRAELSFNSREELDRWLSVARVKEGPLLKIFEPQSDWMRNNYPNRANDPNFWHVCFSADLTKLEELKVEIIVP